MDNNIIYCGRCGAEMKADARYCMKCGNLNPNHEANKSMMQYVPHQSSTYQIGGGATVTNGEQRAGDIITTNKSGGKAACYIFNLLLFFLAIFLETVLVHSFIGDYNKEMLSLWSLVTVGVSFAFLMSVSLQIIYMKANKPWWFVFIPILNYFTYFQIACEKWITGLYFIIFSGLITFLLQMNKFTMLLALIGYILLFLYFLKIQFSLAKKFSVSAILVILFPFIMFPVIAFGGSVYKGIIFNDTRLTGEKDYKFKKFVLTCFLLFLFGGLGITIYYRRDDFVTYADKIKKSYYVYVADQVYYEAKSRFNSSQLSCDKVQFSQDNGTYYLYYPDVGKKIFLVLYGSRESIEVSVKIVVENGTAKYYIAMTDGVYGFDETLYEEIDTDTVNYKRELGFTPYLSDNYCEINYGKTKSA